MRNNQLVVYQLVVILFFLTKSLPAISQSYFLNHYQVEQGLSNNAVLSMIQDRSGFMWFGTKDGLNRFDGYRFKIFRTNEDLQGSIGNNSIYSLKEDKNGTLWVGTVEGLYSYNPANEKFKVTPGTEGIWIRAINEDKEGNLWYISNYTLQKYTRKTGKITKYGQPDSVRVTDICFLSNGDLWLSAGDGSIRKFDQRHKSFSIHTLIPSHHAGDRWLAGIQEVTNNKILVLNSDRHLFLFETRTGTSKKVRIPYSKGQNLFLRSFLKVSEEEIWIASEFGIFIYNPSTGEFRNFQKRQDDRYSLSDNAVHTLYKDKEGGVWVGTYFGGLDYYPGLYRWFKRYSPRIGENSLSGNVVRGLKEDRFGNIWIGTEDAGLNKFNPKTGLFTHFRAGTSEEAISHNNVQAMLISEDKLWVSTLRNGLDIIDISTGRVIKKYKMGPKSGLKSDFIYNLYETATGEKLAGTAEGLYYYNKKTDQFELINEVPAKAWYSSIMEDGKGGIYAGTFGKGLFYYNKQTGERKHYKHTRNNRGTLSNNWVNVCFKDRKGNCWFGTNNGLCRLEAPGGKMVRYGIKQQFPSNYIVSIQEDDRGALWIGTTKGMVRFLPHNGNVEVFNKSKGLISDQFNFGSSLKALDGRLFFGCLKGLVAFDPNEFRQDTRIPPLFITAFEVNTSNVQVEGTIEFLKKSVSFIDRVQLNYKQSDFNVELAGLSFASPQIQKYAFKLEGLSKQWTFLDRTRKVFFTNVPPGTYVFKAKVCNSSGLWSSEQKLLTIQVLPPWWKSKVALVLYFICIILLIMLGLKIYHRQVGLKNRRKLEKLAVTKEKEMLESKMEFFINVAHEIRTPLTLIKVPLPRLLRVTRDIPEIAKSVETISRNTERLIELTNQLLDLRQTEISKFKLNLKIDRIDKILKTACGNFSSLAEQENIIFSLILPQSPVSCLTDLDSLNKILSNLLSNAVKYAESKVEVQLNVSNLRNEFSISVINDGMLIPEVLHEKIFEPFFRLKEHETYNGTGIGLSLARSLAELLGGELTYGIVSGLNQFTLTLPLQLTEVKEVKSNKSTV
ncbi:ligand-binding sensor domain-containing protein [Desertivirga brevis]|uniref:ligand-binding sensor domain-containing protein n=1 Tax=Desertivirga brevis TaxID=2810310 RepID=UPI001A9632CC|nr:two-component regulator propeller domain-containing protein [Pedobacter sp. SYSU D00873]